MSIYTITLKRELLSAADSTTPATNADQQRRQHHHHHHHQRGGDRLSLATTTTAAKEEASQEEGERPTQVPPSEAKNIDSSSKHSSEELVLKSVKVTLEVTVDNLRQPNRIVWYKDSRQITSSERPVLFAKRRQPPPPTSTTNSHQSGATRTRSIKRTVSKKKSTSSAGLTIEETVSVEEEEQQVSRATVGQLSDANTEEDKENRPQQNQEKKCEQESSSRGSKLTIYNLQDEDYAQYTCKLIDSDNEQEEEEGEEKERRASAVERNFKTLRTSSVVNKMDEVIEVKEGDFNIELGIQILPETNEDDEDFMTDEEKADFIDNTTITWFKDDVKLDQRDPEVKKLFQFTFDKQEGFHRLIVRKATKETEGVYTCLVENESGTSSCSTQLVVGPGNRPKLTSGLQDVTVYVGQQLEFRVKSTGLPPIDSCQWFKDDELLVELAGTTQTETRSRLNSRVKMSRHEEYNEQNEKIIIFRLCIENLKLEDTGRLKCRLINEHGHDETECFVKVLQEIIEEHEEVEEHIEETTHLGGGKKSQREEELIEEHEEEESEQSVKRQRQDVEQMEVDSEGQRPRFVRKLSDKTITVTSITSELEEELVVSTERQNEWSESNSMKVRWFVDDQEIVDQLSSSYRIENFYDESAQEWRHRLVIRRLRKESIEITCRASNKFGQDETSCRVQRRRASSSPKTKPQFLRSLEDTETNVGETVIFKVAVDNSSESNRVEDLSFSKDGRLVYSSRRDGERDFETTSERSSRVRVRTYEETITTEEVEEETRTSYYSRRRSSQLSSSPSGARGKRAKVFELTIENTQVDQMGNWACRASNEAGQSECKADLEVFAEPKIVTDLPESVRVSPNREIRLTVEASGSPTPVYSWFKDGLGIAEEEDRVFTETKSTSRTTTTTGTSKRRTSVTSMREEDGVSISGETLIIRDARPEDAGRYECKIENRLGQVKSRECKLTVIGHGDDTNRAPRIIKDLSTQTIEVEEDENVTLKVLAEGQPRPSQHWFKDTEEIVTSSTLTEHFEAENDGQEYRLKIKRSRDIDSGKYRVVLRNEHGEVESRTVEVKVKKVSDQEKESSQRRPSAPTIMLDSQDKTVGLGSNVSFDVQVGGHPKPFISWFKNGRRLTESSDGRVTFVEEETTTTTVIEEKEEGSGIGQRRTIKEVSTVHKLIIRDVKDSDEAIYSLKAENDFGSTKSSLVSLTVDRRKESVDELSKSEQQTVDEQVVEEEEEETTTTTTTREVTKSSKFKTTTEEEEIVEEEDEETRRRRRQQQQKSDRRTSEQIIEEEDEEDGEDETLGGKKKITTKTTTTKTTRTTTSTKTEEQEEAEEEEARRRKQTQEEEEEEESSKKRRVIREEDERMDDETNVEEEEEDESSRRRRVTKMDVDDVDTEQVALDEDEETIRKKRTKSETGEEQRRRRRDSRKDETTTRVDEELIDRRSRKPRIVSAPREVVAGLGSSPQLEIEIETITTTTTEEIETKITWLKDDQEISSRQLRDNHIEIIEKSTDRPDVKKHILRINSLRSSDAGKYKLKAENVDGTTETEEIEVRIDRSMRPGEKPAVTPAEIKPVTPAGPKVAPEVVSVPEEVVAGVGSSPVIEAEVKGLPKPETTWFKDGQPIVPGDHLEVTEQPTDKPDVTRQQLKINDLKPDDAAAYHIRAQNPEGDDESEPTNLRIDRSMGPKDEPIVTGGPTPMEVDGDSTRPDSAKSLPKLPSESQEIKAPLGSSPTLEIPLIGGDLPDEVKWFKDGKPVADSNHLTLETSPDGKLQKLTINEMRPSDEGVYTMRAANEAGEVESAPIKVVAEKRRPSGAKRGEAPTDQVAPSIVSFPEEVVAGRGATPQVVAEVEGLPKPEITWFKDGQPITRPQLRDGHLEIVEIPTDNPNVVKQALKINDLKPADVAAYHIKAENPLGEVESEPTNVRIDRSMGPRDEPVVTGATPSAPDQPEDLPSKKRPSMDQVAPSIVSMPDEIVAGLGSEPEIVAEVAGKPAPEVTWFKDGRPITKSQLRDGHLEIVEIPTDQPDIVKQALKINDLKPADVAAYHIKAENPLGEVVSEPTGVKIDRSMGPRDEPVVTETTAVAIAGQPYDLAAEGKPSVARTGDQVAPSIISMPDEIVAGPGSKPQIVAEVAGNPAPEVTWFKDGKPVNTRDGHLKVAELPSAQPDVVKQALTIDGMRPADVAAYHVEAENPLGVAESQPTNVKLDRSMGPRDEPVVVGAKPDDSLAGLSTVPSSRAAPKIVSVPREVVAGRGSSPVIEAVVTGQPKPEVVWFKDGQKISPRQLADGRLEIQEIPTGNDDGEVRQVLRINDMKPSDVARYHIRAENPLGCAESEPTSLRLDRSMGPRDEQVVVGGDSQPADHHRAAGMAIGDDQVAPSILSVPAEIVAGLGSKPVLVAEVSGKPAPEVSWFKDGQPIIDDDHLKIAELPSGRPDVVRQALTIDGMKPADVAAYHVRAENPLGEAESEPTNVRIDRSKGPGDEEITVAPESAAVAPDELAQAKPLEPKRKLRAPVIKRLPKQVVASEGDSPVLEVEVSGEPIPEIVWFRNGVRIERSDAHYKFEELPEEGVYRMQLKNVDKLDEATYTVQASNEAGTVESGPIKLTVDTAGKRVPRGFAPKITRAPKEVVAAAGSSPVIEIELKASPRADLTWFKDGQPIGRRQLADKFTTTETTLDQETSQYVMTIHDLEPSDVGTYHIKAENTFGEVHSEPISVRLDRRPSSASADDASAAGPTETSGKPADGDEDRPRRKLRAPVIKRMPRKIVAALGSSPVIEIEVSGEPKPEIVWFRNGQRVTERTNHIRIEETPNGVYRLCFTNLKATDQAEYTITATNEAGTVESEPVQLIVDRTMKKTDEPFVQEAVLADLLPDEIDGKPVEAPQILRLRDQEALPGQTVKLEAEVVGHPKPEIKWLKDGDEVELNIINEVPTSNVHSLTLKNVNDLYDGVYSLEAKNIAGTARKDARVSVVEQLTERAQPVSEEATAPVRPTVELVKRKEPEERAEKPFIRRGLKFSQVNQGRSIKFEVQIDGKYDELVWMKDGQQINVPFELDTVAGPEEEEEEEDADETSTLVGSDTESADLRTGDDLVSGRPKRRFPPKILMRPRNVVAGRGSRVAFEVRCSGEPKPEVHWFKNGKRIEQTADGKIIVEEFSDGGVRLVIEDVQEFDLGEYHVVCENPFGNERTIPVRLEIDEHMFASDDLANTTGADYQPDLKTGKAPRILSRPRPVHSSRGSRVAFEVQVSGEPVPIINWFRDGRLIAQSSDGRVTIEEYSNGCVSRLVLDDIGDTDVAQYHLVAENKHGSERTIPVTLTIDETRTDREDLVEEFEEISSLGDHDSKRKRNGRPPRILLRPKNVQARPGSQVELEVSVVGQSKPSIVWYKNGKQVTSTSDGRVRVEQISETYQKLILTDVSESDAGQYSVSAENDFGVSMSNEVKMEVSSNFAEEITTTTTTETTETFYERFVSDGTGDDDGGAGKKRRAPRFTVKPRNKKAPIGSKVDFEVRVTGEPKPDVVWYKNGRRIHTSSDGRVRVEEFSDGGSKLVIEDLEETDHGVYAAEAKNEWGQARTEDVQLRVTQRTELSEHREVTMRGSSRVTTKTKKTRSHYTFSEERHGYVTLTLNDAQLDHDGDYKLIVRNKWGEASTQAPLVVIPKVEPRNALSMDRSATGYEDSSLDGRDSRARRTPFDELEDYGHELDKSVGVFGSESRYQSGDDTYLLQLRDTEFPLRLRKYLRFGARQSPSLRSNLMDAHWGAGARVTIRERRKFREVMDEEIDDEKRGLDLRPTPMRLQKEVGTCGYAAAQLEHLRVEAAERVARKSQGRDDEASSASSGARAGDDAMMPPFFREKLKDAVVEEAGASRQQVAVFACLAAGEPKPEYTWFRNDIIITNEAALTASNRMQIISRPDGGSELHIRDPRLLDSGCFKCVARNVHGNVTCRARLRVASRPSRPEPPEYVSVTSREVFLQWRPPRDYDTNAAEVLGYKLEMSQSSIGQEDKWIVLGADIGHEFYVVDDLTPGTSYSFRISARNKFGWSDSSYSTYVTTARDGSDAAARLQVPHEMRSRQYTSDICDIHQLRTGEDPKRPKMNYQLELSPVQLKTNDNWLDHYSLQTEIARGRFSVISKAASKTTASQQESDEHDEDSQQQQQVVVKTVLVESMASAQTKNEFDIMRSLQHEKVARLQVAFKTDDMFVFVMERLSGIDVLTYLSSYTTYNEETVSRIITQVMDAIEYLHFRGMCLLELLPDNVVMTNGRSTSIKLVDFSSARFVPRSGARVPLNTSQNIEYCPPEVIANHEVSTASDVWCIGVLTYVLLSGFSPFKGETEDETRENVRLGRYKYDHIYGNCTPEVTRFLINVFKKHSSKRPTIEQLYENKWLLPNEFMIRKRQQAIFKTDKIVAFAEEFHKQKQQQSPPQKLIDLLARESS